MSYIDESQAYIHTNTEIFNFDIEHRLILEDIQNQLRPLTKQFDNGLFVFNGDVPLEEPCFFGLFTKKVEAEYNTYYPNGQIKESFIGNKKNKDVAEYTQYDENGNIFMKVTDERYKGGDFKYELYNEGVLQFEAVDNDTNSYFEDFKMYETEGKNKGSRLFHWIDKNEDGHPEKIISKGLMSRNSDAIYIDKDSDGHPEEYDEKSKDYVWRDYDSDGIAEKVYEGKYTNSTASNVYIPHTWGESFN